MEKWTHIHSPKGNGCSATEGDWLPGNVQLCARPVPRGSCRRLENGLPLLPGAAQKLDPQAVPCQLHQVSDPQSAPRLV